MASELFLLGRMLLQFSNHSSDLSGNISAATLSPSNHLWLGSDELNTIERLSPLHPYHYGEQQTFAIADFLELDPDGSEVDIEGMEYSNFYLWFTGSHSKKRKRMKGKSPKKDIQRLTELCFEPNRYTIARIPLVDGNLYKSCPHPTKPSQILTAAYVKRNKNGNLLTRLLQDDEHLKDFVKTNLPSKENGFDIEGLAVYKERIFLGLRGPVLRGWAIILEIKVEDSEPGILTLNPSYKKHFVYLDGLGIRELCFHNEDLLILAGATMDLVGATRLFRLQEVLTCPGDRLCDQASPYLQWLADLPFHPTADKAEGLVLIPYWHESQALLVLYDSPARSRFIGADTILMDMFKL